MTDVEAIGVLGTRFSLDFRGVRNLDEKVCAAIFYCMQAVEDRAQLCDAIYAYEVDAGVSAKRTRAAVRRHMAGQE